MAMILPQHRAAPVQAQRSTFTVEAFFDRMLDAVNAQYDGTRSKSIYLAYGIKLEQEKANVIATLKANFDAVVKNSLDNGYNLLSHASLGNLSDASIINALNLDESEEHVDDWINAHFTSTIAAVDAHIADINSKIPDVLKAKIKEIDDEFDKVLGDYEIKSSDLTSSSQLGIKIAEFKKDVEREFETFVGTPYDKYFYEKNSFPIAAKIAEEMAKKEFTDAIVPTVRQKMEAEIHALTKRPNADVRTYAEDVYNFIVKGKHLDWSDIDTRYMAGIKAIIDKYTRSGKIVINPPRTNDEIVNSKTEIKLYVEVSIGQSKFTVESIGMPLNKHNYAIEYLSTMADASFGSNPPETKFRDSAGWTEGQEITEQDIKDNIVGGHAADKWSDFFAAYAAYKASGLGGNTEVKYFFINDGIHIQFIDNSIQPTDFDYGDLTPLDTPKKMEHLFNRHESVEHKSEYDRLTHSILFDKPLIYNKVIGVKFVTRLDEFESLIKDATSQDNNKQPDEVPLKTLLKADGTNKELTKADILKIFPNIQTDFFDEFEKETTYTISYKTKVANTGLHDQSVVEVTIKSASGERKVDIVVNTYDDDKIISDTENALKAYENTWEDKTPSKEPMAFNAPGPGSFAAGTTPDLPMLSDIFKDIEKSFVKIQTGTPPVEIKLLKIKPSTMETAESRLTVDMLESWNKDLIEELGGLTDDMRHTISYAIASAGFLGKSKMSKYLYANVEMSLPTVKNYKMIAVHYLSHEQRFIEYHLIEEAMKMFTNSYLQNIFQEHEVPESVKQKVLAQFKTMSDPLVARIKTLLDPDNPNAEIPDFILHRVANVIQDLKMNLKDIKNQYNLNPEDLKKLKTASKVFKYVLTTVGGMIGLSALMALLIPIRTALGDRKLKKENPQAKRSSKKMIIVSAISGLLAAGSSVAIMIYVFLTQGGL